MVGCETISETAADALWAVFLRSIFAQVIVAMAALKAGRLNFRRNTIGFQKVHNYPVTLLQAGDIRSNLGDLSQNLVPQIMAIVTRQSSQTDSGIGFDKQQVQVTGADAAHAVFYTHPAGSG